MSDDSEPVGYSGSPSRAYSLLVFAVILPPFLMMFGMQINYIINDQICRNGWCRVWLHPTFIVVLLIIVWLGRYALRYWPDDPWPLADESDRSIHRFTGLLGVGSAALFGLIVIAQWLAAVMLDPCL